MQASGIWSALLQPNKPLYIVPGGTLKVTNVALGFDVGTKHSGYTRLTFGYPHSDGAKKVQTVLATLHIAFSEQLHFRTLYLNAGEEYTFEANGIHPIQLLGYYIEEGDEPSTAPGITQTDTKSMMNAELSAKKKGTSKGRGPGRPKGSKNKKEKGGAAET